MKILLDTHAFLWAITEDAQLSLRAREIFTARTSELFLSVASIWEILIKVQLKKLPLTKPVVPFLREQLANNNIHVLPIVLDHVARLEDLPVHHRDPFDRILVAQSLEEGWPLLSADPLLARYPTELIW
jgi:PIN domain nuclease of toxin-antitoxin system